MVMERRIGVGGMWVEGIGGKGGRNGLEGGGSWSGVRSEERGEERERGVERRAFLIYLYPTSPALLVVDASLGWIRQTSRRLFFCLLAGSHPFSQFVDASTLVLGREQLIRRVLDIITWL